MITTVFENAAMVKELFNALPQTFQPSIPNLVYQVIHYVL